jgi:S1-C subfamily serine protease
MGKQFALMIASIIIILYGLSLTKANSLDLNFANQPRVVVPEETAVTTAVKNNLPSVVTIAVEHNGTNENIGSGFIVSSDGLIVTNRHVVSDVGANYSVITNNNQLFKVSRIYRDPLNDLAILKIDATNLKPVVFADSSALQLGQLAIAIGTPLGEFRNTVTTGIVSGLSRGITANSPFLGSVEQLNNVIQTDAPISPGNSGGPLLNSNGEVIGVNTAVSVAGSNIGFAIPSNVVRDLLNAFKNNNQNFQQPYLGIRYITLDQNQARLINVAPGAYIVEVVPNSPADKAGLKAEDVIVKFDNNDLSTANSQELGLIILQHKIGDTIAVTVWRNGQNLSKTITLEAAK